MESVLMTHPERAMPGCVREFRITCGNGATLAHVLEHHQSRWQLHLPEAVSTNSITLEILQTWGGLPAIYEVRVYE
jgi:hypothetical protein